MTDNTGAATPRCDTCPFGTPSRQWTLCHYRPLTDDNSGLVNKDYWCRHHPLAPRIVTVREAVAWTRDINDNPILVDTWREWQVVEPRNGEE